MSKYVSTLWVIVRAGQTLSKIVKEHQKVSSTIVVLHQLSGPFWGALFSIALTLTILSCIGMNFPGECKGCPSLSSPAFVPLLGLVF